ncbi:MAG TPA: hypothetical protein VGN32_20525 [Ktedonobacterales bacterium]|nr:hypothetical protein [Ktedonobacterales bacterium]
MLQNDTVSALVAQKLHTFARLEPSFEAGFQFAQEIQGQRRFSGMPVRHIVYYLHALLVCALKDRLLGIPRAGDRYEGEECLRLMRQWQDGDSADVMALLERKLDGSSLADLTRTLELVSDAASAQERDGFARTLRRGRQVLLNRLANRLQAIDTLTGLSREDLIRQVRQACVHHGHTPAQIDRQLLELGTPLYQEMAHPALARRNMLVMARMGIQATDGRLPDREQDMARPSAHVMPERPYAEQVIAPYVPLSAPSHNNVAGVRFVDRPEIVILPLESDALGQAHV